MKKTRIFLSILLIAATAMTGTATQAQTLNSGDILYHSFHSPQATRLNPAFFPSDASFYISGPRVGFGLSMPMSYSDLGMHVEGDSTVLDLNHILEQIETTGTRFGLTGDGDILGFGFKIKPLGLRINAALGVKLDGTIDVPTDMAKLVTEGNTGQNRNLTMSANDMMIMQAYGYLSLGASMELPMVSNLTVGARLNILDGIFVSSVKSMNINLVTGDHNENLRLSADYLINSAGMYGLKNKGKLKYSFERQEDASFSNFGFTFDLGANYHIGDYDISLSLLDVGPGICWSNNAMTLEPKHKGSSVTFDGMNLTTLLTDGVVDTATLYSYGDSLMNMIAADTTLHHFWSGVPTRLYLGASYSMGPLLRLGYLFHGEWNRGLFYRNSTFRFNNTLSATANLMDWMDLTIANSITFDGNGMDFLNPGISASINLFRRLQVYGAIDYSSNLYLVNIKSFRFFAGISFVALKTKPFLVIPDETSPLESSSSDSSSEE